MILSHQLIWACEAELGQLAEAKKGSFGLIVLLFACVGVLLWGPPSVPSPSLTSLSNSDVCCRLRRLCDNVHLSPPTHPQHIPITINNTDSEEPFRMVVDCLLNDIVRNFNEEEEKFHVAEFEYFNKITAISGLLKV